MYKKFVLIFALVLFVTLAAIFTLADEARAQGPICNAWTHGIEDGGGNTKLYNIWGNTDGTLVTVPVTTTLTNERRAGGLGSITESTFPGDINNDGLTDWVHGIVTNSNTIFYTYLGQTDGTYATTSVDTTVTGDVNLTGSDASSESSFIGDVTGDGYDDWVHGYESGGNSTIVRVLAGQANGSFSTVVTDTTINTDLVAGGWNDLDESTYLGDINGDGNADWVHAIEGLPTAGNTNFFVYLGQDNGTFVTTARRVDIPYIDGFGFTGNNSNDESTFVTDVDYDGYADWIHAKERAAPGRTELFVVRGTSTGDFATTVVTTTIPIDLVSGNVSITESSFAADINGDNFADWVHAIENNGAGGSPTVFYVYPGAATGKFATTAITTSITASLSHGFAGNNDNSETSYIGIGTCGGPATTGPGGVTTNLGLWLKANEGGISWTDQSGAGVNVSGAGNPTALSASINFNDSVDFDGDDHYDLSSANFAGNKDNARSFYLVARPDTLSGSRWAFGYGATSAGNSQGQNLGLVGDGRLFHSAISVDTYTSETTPWATTQPTLAVFSYDGTSPAFYANGGSLTVGADSTSSWAATIDGSVGRVGRFNSDGFNEYWDGEIAEVVYYSADLTDAEQNKVESYLAIKYGVTLTGTQAISYTASDGTTVWDAGVNAAYHHDMAGVGVDAGSVLTQTKSHSINDDSIVTIDAGIISADGSFMLWGNNNGSTTIDQTAGAYTTMSRVWRVAETGTIAETSVQITDTITATHLFVDSDTDFSDATAIALTDSGSGFLFASRNFTNGQYFTFGTAGTNNCWATIDATTVYSSADSQAVRDAVGAAGNGNTVKVAGTCAGVSSGNLATIGINITVQGGYTHTNWMTSNPNTYPTTLDAQRAGQVLYIHSGADVTVDGLNIINGNETGGDQRGGGIQVHFSDTGSVLTVTNSHFENNFANAWGGAIDNGAQAPVTISNTTFISNTAGTSGAGGALTINGGSPDTYIYTSVFTDNTAMGQNGGALAIWGGNLHLSDSRFYGNAARGSTHNGGAIYLATNASINNSNFISNTAATGGAIYATSGITVTGSDFISNTATVAQIGGGALALTAGTSSISGSTFTGNNYTVTTNNVDGGAIHNGAGSTMLIDATTFTKNAGAGDSAEGGAIFNDGTLTVTASTFSHNYGDSGAGWGGGALLNTGNATIINSTFYSNTTASSGGAIAQYGGTLTAINNTLSHNSQGSGGSLNASGGTTHLTNTIIANTVAGADCAGTLTTNTANLIEDNTCTPAVSSDPNLGPLQNNGGDTWTMAITGTSPAIDTGNDASAPATDQRGVSRPQGCAADIGAYEAAGTCATTGPGGVATNLGLWLKANAGVYNDAGTTLAGNDDNALQWHDQSGSVITQAQIAATSNITYMAGAANFNPTVKFDGTSGQRLAGEATQPFSDTSTIFAVAKDNGTSVLASGIFASSEMPTSPSIAGQGLIVDNGKYVIDGSGAVASTSASTTSPIDRYRVLTGLYADTGTTQNASIYLDGALEEQDTTSTLSLYNGTLFEIGGRTWWPGNETRIYNGEIAEVVYYGTELTAAEQNRVESYLALKYGITLAGTQAISYTASDGTTVWDVGVNAMYHNDVAGIGIDAGSVLTQTKSRSINDDSIVTLTGTTADMVNDEFLLWGNNNGALDASNNVPGGYSQRLERVWKIQETGDTGNVTISFDLSGVSVPWIDFSNTTGFALLVDADGNFDNASVTTGASINGSVVTFSGTNLDFTQPFFSLAYPLVPAETFTITSPSDPGDGTCDTADCTLREAIKTAPPGSTIVFSESYTISLTTELTVTKPLTIDGTSKKVTINGGGNGRVFSVTNTSATFIALTLTSGNAGSGNGGGIGAVGSNVTVEKCTVNGNSTTGNGGGIGYESDNTTGLKVVNSTIAGNTAADGGGIWVNGTSSAAQVELWSDTVANNTATAGVGGFKSTNTNHDVTNVILADNSGTTTHDCDAAGTGTFTANNIIETSGGICANSSPSTTDPGLGALADNGGDTWTMIIGAGSSAYNTGTDHSANMAAEDQRGVTRPQEDSWDIGAYELDSKFYYLPLITKAFIFRPNLEVTGLDATGGTVSLTIRNTGNTAINEAFWVDVYFNPTEMPSLNKRWSDIAPAGAVWGVTQSMGPNESLTLTVGDTYYDATRSSDSLPGGAQVYAYVDSINFATNYGNVLETNEGDNLHGPVVSAAGISAAGLSGGPVSVERLPVR